MTPRTLTACWLLAAAAAASLAHAQYASPYTIDPTTETPEGEIAEFGDLTAALQWCCDNVATHRREIKIPSGVYFIGATVTTPEIIGFSLLGSGINHPPASTGQYSSASTVLVWFGPADVPMFDWQSEGGHFGNFTLECHKQTGSPGVAARSGVQFSRGAVSTSNVRVHPLWIEHAAGGAVQMGSATGDNNCDNIFFEWLKVHHSESCYHGVNAQGVDINIEHLINTHNTYGVLLEGGGHLHVKSSITLDPGTALLRITDSANVARYNGSILFTQAKIDSRTVPDLETDTYMLVDSANDNDIQITFRGGQFSEKDYAGPLVNATGRNKILFDDFAASFSGLNGAESSEGISPIIELRSCRVWDFQGTPAFTGSWNEKRIVGCVDQQNNEIVASDFGGVDYRTAAEVQAIIDTNTAGFQTAGAALAAVEAEIENAASTLHNAVATVGGGGADFSEYRTETEILALVNDRLGLPGAVAVSVPGQDLLGQPLPKANQPRRLALDVSGIPQQQGATLDDVTAVRVVIKKYRASGTVFDKNSLDHPAIVTLPAADGVVTCDLATSDFGAAGLEAARKYYVVTLVQIAGEWVEADQLQRLQFTYDQE